MDLEDIRREYLLEGLREKDLPNHPSDLFQTWLQQVIDWKIVDPTAMTIATVDENLMPYQRIVLLKHFDEKGFVLHQFRQSKSPTFKAKSTDQPSFPLACI